MAKYKKLRLRAKSRKAKTSGHTMADPRPVDFRSNDCDWEVVQLAKVGTHQRAISEKTGLTKSQVTYRLRMAGVSARDYRDGKSTEFRRVWSMTDEIWTPAKAKATRAKLDTAHIDLLAELKAARARKQQTSKTNAHKKKRKA